MNKVLSVPKKVKSILSLLLVVSLMLSCVAVPASAAKTKSAHVVSYNAVAGGTIREIHHTYTIKGSFLFKKKVSFQSDAIFYDKSFKNAFRKLATFDVKVHDKRGKLVYEYRNLKMGGSFKLPRGSQNYTIYVASKFKGYNIHNTAHNGAALVGTFRLKY